jgi:two-component sensor histidine kinase
MLDVNQTNGLAIEELRHRVSNDLAILSLVLERRKRGLAEITAGEAMDDAIDSLIALSMLYRQLVVPGQSEASVHSVEMGSYLRSICAQLQAAYLVPLGIVVDVDAQAGFIRSRAARDIGLMVAELIGNAAKHAFPRRPGHIRLVAACAGPSWVYSICDNGIGFSPRISPEAHGLERVIRMAHAYGGTLDLASQSAETRATLTIPVAAICDAKDAMWSSMHER